MFTILPEFVACNLKCDLLVLQRLVNVVLTILKYMVTGVLMGLKAKSSTFKEFCEKCSLWNYYACLFLTQIVRVFSSKI